MQKAIQQEADLGTAEHAGGKSRGFNYNKLQAVICIASSAFLSVLIIAWIASSFF